MIRPLILAAACLFSTAAMAERFDCPRTIGSDKAYIDKWPAAESWYGSKDLAVRLPKSGIWPTTQRGHSISVKLFWYIDGFVAGEEDRFVGSIRRLDPGDNDAVLSQPTNAGGASLGDWTVLTGIDFPSAGCWEVSGNFNGKKLRFVVETASYDFSSLNTETRDRNAESIAACNGFLVREETNNYCATKPPAEWKPFEYAGETYFFQPFVRNLTLPQFVSQVGSPAWSDWHN